MRTIDMEGRQDRLWGWPIFRFLKIWRQASLSYRQRLRVNGSRVYPQIIFDTLLFLSEKVLTVQREYSILGARGRGPGFYTRLADYMGYTIEEFAGYRAKIQKYRKTQANAEKEKAELTDSFKLEQRVSQLLADYVAKGGDLSRRRNSREETAE